MPLSWSQYSSSSIVLSPQLCVKAPLIASDDLYKASEANLQVFERRKELNRVHKCLSNTNLMNANNILNRLYTSDLIPEDGDEISHPNVFSVGNIQSPTLGQIRKLFPIPGRYHYRYLKNLGTMTVWMDAVDDALVVPPFDGKIFLKASRISENMQRPPTDSPRQLQQAPSRSSNVSNVPRATIPKPPSSSETLLAFGSDDINENDMQSAGNHHVIGGSFMDSNNNDLIGLGSESSVNNLPKSSSNLDMFGIDSLQPTLLPMSTPPSLNTSYSSGSPNRNHIQQDNSMGGRGMNGMGSNTGGGGQGPGPIRGISPHPMMDAFSGLGSQPQNTRQMPQIRRPY